MKEIVREGKMGASLLPIVDGHGLNESERVNLFRKIADGKIPTTGTTLQQRLMPLIERAPDPVRERLIMDSDYTLEDAEMEVKHLERVEAAKKAMESGQVYEEPPMSVGEFGLRLERKILDLSRVIDQVSASGFGDNVANWLWDDIVATCERSESAMERLAKAIADLRVSRGKAMLLGELPALDEPSAEDS